MDISMIKKASDLAVKRGTLTTIFGDAGAGKTVFAAHCWPTPVFVPIEWGLLSASWVDATPTPKTTDDVKKFVTAFGVAVKNKELSNKTLVLDSLSKFDNMIAAELCKEGDVKSLKKFGGGYGAGADAQKMAHKELREIIERLLVIGVHVVCISHADIVDIKPPDGEGYHQWNLQMSKGGREQWINQADAVIHIRAPMIVSKAAEGEKRKIAMDTGSHRLIDMTAGASTTAKNRFGVNQEFRFEMDGEGKFNNPIADIYGFDIKETGNNG